MIGMPWGVVGLALEGLGLALGGARALPWGGVWALPWAGVWALPCGVLAWPLTTAWAVAEHNGCPGLWDLGTGLRLGVASVGVGQTGVLFWISRYGHSDICAHM